MLAVLRSIRPTALIAALVAATMLATSTVDIAPGDTLTSIAARKGITVAQLVEWNDIADPDFIVAGETLVIRAETSDGDGRSHVVEQGDTLSVLAARFGTTVGALVALNDISDPDRIIAGQVLELSAESASDDSTESDGVDQDAGSPDSPDGSIRYLVEPGDTLRSIARAHGLKARDLAKANDISDPDLIFIGQILAIPEQSDDAPDESRDPATTTVPPAPTEPETTTTEAPSPSTVPEVTPDASTGLATLFERWSLAYGVDRSLLEALLWHESGWRVDAVGPGGHLGIGQLSPDTVEFIESRLLGLDLDPLDASDGIQMAARYLRYLLDRTIDERTGLAAWNQGLHGVNTEGVSATAGVFADEVLAIRSQRS